MSSLVESVGEPKRSLCIQKSQEHTADGSLTHKGLQKTKFKAHETTKGELCRKDTNQMVKPLEYIVSLDVIKLTLLRAPR